MNIQSITAEPSEYIRRKSWPKDSMVENSIEGLSGLPTKDIEADDWETHGKDIRSYRPTINTLNKLLEIKTRRIIELEQEVESLRRRVSQ